MPMEHLVMLEHRSSNVEWRAHVLFACISSGNIINDDWKTRQGILTEARHKFVCVVASHHVLWCLLGVPTSQYSLSVFTLGCVALRCWGFLVVCNKKGGFGGFWGGSARRAKWIATPALFVLRWLFTNHRNKGLISVDRRTCLLSYVQYPVSIKVVYKGFNALSARKAIEYGVGPEPIATREHREQIYRRFPA